MIGFEEIVKGVAARLGGLGYAVYGEDIGRAAAAEGPVMTVAVVSAKEEQCGPVYFDRLVRIRITGARGAKMSNAEFYAFVANLNGRLRQPIAFSDRYIMPKDIEYALIDGMASYTFSLRFLDDGIVSSSGGEIDMAELVI